jgi:hypothetical protein
MVIYLRFASKLEKEGSVQFLIVEAESNPPTVALRVVGGDKMGSLVSETVKYGHESNGTLTRE